MSKENKKPVKRSDLERQAGHHKDSINLCNAIRRVVTLDDEMFFPLEEQHFRHGYITQQSPASNQMYHPNQGLTNPSQGSMNCQEEQQQQQQPLDDPRTEMPQQVQMMGTSMLHQNQIQNERNIGLIGNYMQPTQKNYYPTITPDFSVPPPPLGYINPAYMQAHHENHQTGSGTMSQEVVQHRAQPGKHHYLSHQNGVQSANPSINQVSSVSLPLTHQVIPKPMQQVQQPVQHLMHLQTPQPINMQHTTQSGMQSYEEYVPFSTTGGQQMNNTHAMREQVVSTTHLTPFSNEQWQSHQGQRVYHQLPSTGNKDQLPPPQQFSYQAVPNPVLGQLPQQPNTQFHQQHPSSTSNQQMMNNCPVAKQVTPTSFAAPSMHQQQTLSHRDEYQKPPLASSMNHPYRLSQEFSQQTVHPPGYVQMSQQHSNIAEHNPLHQQALPWPNIPMPNGQQQLLSNHVMETKEVACAPTASMPIQGNSPSVPMQASPKLLFDQFGNVYSTSIYSVPVLVHHQQGMQLVSNGGQQMNDQTTAKGAPPGYPFPSRTQIDCTVNEKDVPLPNQVVSATVAAALLRIRTEQASGPEGVLEQENSLGEQSSCHMSVIFPTPPYSVHTSSTRAHSVEEFTFGFDDSLAQSTSNRAKPTTDTVNVVKTPILVKQTPATSSTVVREATAAQSSSSHVAEPPSTQNTSQSIKSASKQEDETENSAKTTQVVPSVSFTHGGDAAVQKPKPGHTMQQTSTSCLKVTKSDPHNQKQSVLKATTTGTNETQNTQQGPSTFGSPKIRSLPESSQSVVSPLSAANSLSLKTSGNQTKPVLSTSTNKPMTPQQTKSVSNQAPAASSKIYVATETKGKSTTPPATGNGTRLTGNTRGNVPSSVPKENDRPSQMQYQPMIPQQTKPVSIQKPLPAAAFSEASVRTEIEGKPKTPSATGVQNKTTQKPHASQKANELPSQMKKASGVAIHFSERKPISKSIETLILRKTIPATEENPRKAQISSGKQAVASPLISKTSPNESKSCQEPSPVSEKATNEETKNNAKTRSPAPDRSTGTSQKKKKSKTTKKTKKSVADELSEEEILQEAIRVAREEREAMKKEEIPSLKQQNNNAENKRKLNEKIKKCEEVRKSTNSETAGGHRRNETWYDLSTEAVLREGITNYDAASEEEMRLSQRVKPKNSTNIDLASENIMKNVLGNSHKNNAYVQRALNEFCNSVLENMVSEKEESLKKAVNFKEPFKHEFDRKVIEFMLEKTELNNSQKRREQMRAAMKFMAERAKQVEIDSVLYKLYNYINFNGEDVWFNVMYYLSQQPEDILPEAEAEFIDSFN